MSVPLHILKFPQKKRILELLKIRGSQGAYVWELTGARPDGLGCQQYNARIKELRESGYNIVNVSPGHFVLKGLTTSKSIAFSEPKTVSPNELKGEARRTWQAMGAYLRGEGPKPKTEPGFEQVVQEAMF